MILFPVLLVTLTLDSIFPGSSALKPWISTQCSYSSFPKWAGNRLLLMEPKDWEQRQAQLHNKTKSKQTEALVPRERGFKHATSWQFPTLQCSLFFRESLNYPKLVYKLFLSPDLFILNLPERVLVKIVCRWWRHLIDLFLSISTESLHPSRVWGMLDSCRVHSPFVTVHLPVPCLIRPSPALWSSHLDSQRCLSHVLPVWQNTYLPFEYSVIWFREIYSSKTIKPKTILYN